MVTRQEFLQTKISQGFGVNDINKELSKKGKPLLSHYEANNIKPYNFLKEVKGDIGELKSSIPTITGGIARYATDDKFRRKVNKENKWDTSTIPKVLGGVALGALAGSEVPIVGNIAGGIAGGVLASGKGKQALDAMLSTYNLSTDKIAKGDIDFNAIKAGASVNPLWTGLDALSLGGAKAIAKASPAVTKAIQESKLHPYVRNLLPDEEMRQVSTALKQTKSTVQGKSAPVARLAEQLYTAPRGVDMAEIYRNITTNKPLANEASKQVAKQARVTSKLIARTAEQEGLIPKGFTKENTIAQYAVYQSPKKIQHVQALQALDKYRRGLRIDPELENIFKEGEDLYKKGKIAFVSQVLAPNKEASVVPIKKGKTYFEQGRYSGNAPAEDMGKILPESFEFLIKQLDQSRASTSAIEAISNLTGTKVSPKDVARMGAEDIKGSVILSKAKAKDLFAGNLGMPEKDFYSKVSTALKGINSKSAHELRKYSEDLMVVDKKHLRALENSLSGMKPTVGTKLNKMFKKAQLTTLKWLAENRIGNTYNNSLEGVTAKDYLDASKYKRYMPEQLPRETSYASFTGDASSKIGGPKPIIQGEKLALSKLKRALKNKDWTGALENTTDLVAKPVVTIESSLELRDRFANYIKQARAYGKANNMSTAKVLATAKKNEDLFWTLNKEVERSMGDYTGRNYYLPPALYETANWAMPFWKFPTQTARVTGRQMVNNPLGFYTSTILPAKQGKEEWKEIQKKYRLGSENFQGGFPVDDKMRSIYDATPFYSSSSLPPVALAQLASALFAGDRGDVLNNLSPLLSDVAEVANFQGYAGQPASTPKAFTYNGKQYKMEDGRPTGELFKPSTADYSKYALAKLANDLFAGTVVYNRMLRPLAYGTHNLAEPNAQLPMYPAYDTDIFAGQGNPLGIPKTSPVSLLGSQLGLKTSNIYPEYKTSLRDRLKIQKAFARKKLRGERK